MPHFTFPTDYDDIVALHNDANNLAEDNERLKRLLKTKLKSQGRPSTSTSDASKQPALKLSSSKPTPSASNGANGASAWAAAPSVADVKSKSVNLGGAKIKFKQRPVEPALSDDSDDSGTDAPLVFKMKSNGTGPKKTIKKKDKVIKAGGKEGKEKPFKGSTAYNVYFGERTTALRKETPELDRSEIAKKVGAGWKELTNEEKARLQEEADKRNAVKRAAYEAAKANGSVSTLEACAVENDEEDDNDD